MQDFVAIDFETANGRRSSVCSVGIVIVRGGEIYQDISFTYRQLLGIMTWKTTIMRFVMPRPAPRLR